MGGPTTRRNTPSTAPALRYAPRGAAVCDFRRDGLTSEWSGAGSRFDGALQTPLSLLRVHSEPFALNLVRIG